MRRRSEGVLWYRAAGADAVHGSAAEAGTGHTHRAAAGADWDGVT